MQQEDLDRLREQVTTHLGRRFPDAPIDRIEVLQYGDDPQIEPGQYLTRVYIQGEDGEGDQALEDFHRAYREAFEHLREDVKEHPALGTLEFLAAGAEGQKKHKAIRLQHPLPPPGAGAGPLTPVMARMGPEDLETLDTLITAGIAASRAEGVRWALARIRERPAYAKLRARAREIEELKSQF